MSDNASLLARRRVLVVEDQYLVADEMRRAVQALGGEVIGPAPRAEIGLQLLGGEGVDLALLDINLGAEDVYPLAMELSRRGTPFIFATGCEPWIVAEEFRAAPRLEKPITAKALTDAIQRLDAGRAK
jgi:DNA-binding LytR/AlgR family response regulator